jgi:uncharacterized metal-binding protein YceD (DUF177 family)
MIQAMKPDSSSWSVVLRLADVQRNSPVLELTADAAQRAALAARFDLLELKRLSAEVRLAPWLDGAEIRARWGADIVQTCGMTLEPFDTALSGDFTVRVVPADSPAAANVEEEVAVDPEADDPPDVLEDDAIDVAAYLVEYLALEIDPFPRKPGVVFEPPPEERPPSPFAVLQSLKGTSKPGDSEKP